MYMISLYGTRLIVPSEYFKFLKAIANYLYNWTYCPGLRPPRVAVELIFNKFTDHVPLE